MLTDGHFPQLAAEHLQEADSVQVDQEPHNADLKEQVLVQLHFLNGDVLLVSGPVLVDVLRGCRVRATVEVLDHGLLGRIHRVGVRWLGLAEEDLPLHLNLLAGQVLVLEEVDVDLGRLGCLVVNSRGKIAHHDVVVR